ncbi:hypothetical protein ABZ359_34290 [Streptomyces sp. NPDC005968]|uniref:hypothetical protein n=1 Tax=Streptomyces sp. NPDC005968 TaxID=3154574 RepID=UPI0033D680FA
MGTSLPDAAIVWVGRGERGITKAGLEIQLPVECGQRRQKTPRTLSRSRRPGGR